MTTQAPTRQATDEENSKAELICQRTAAYVKFLEEEGVFEGYRDQVIGVYETFLDAAMYGYGQKIFEGWDKDIAEKRANDEKRAARLAALTS